VNSDRQARLAKRLEEVARRDEARIRRELETEELRRQAAAELYAMCAAFVESLNRLMTQIRLELSPERYAPEMFHDPGPNIFQMQASGRILQLGFDATAPLISTEHYRTPYILEGAVRWFNQDSLEGLGIREHQLFYCIEKRARYWLYFDAQAHRRGAVSEDYLAERFEELL
jgi:hypothetical protein